MLTAGTVYALSGSHISLNSPWGAGCVWLMGNCWLLLCAGVLLVQHWRAEKLHTLSNSPKLFSWWCVTSKRWWETVFFLAYSRAGMLRRDLLVKSYHSMAACLLPTLFQSNKNGGRVLLNTSFNVFWQTGESLSCRGAAVAFTVWWRWRESQTENSEAGLLV